MFLEERKGDDPSYVSKIYFFTIKLFKLYKIFYNLHPVKRILSVFLVVLI